MIQHQMNGKMLEIKPIFYTIDRKNENNSKCFWKCERTGNRSIPKCYGRVNTVFKEEYFFGPVKFVREHNHEPKPE